ncbi:hypothetical protein D1007_49467 [Hordeum vulgare]|nr:hypothetical protein D1007_49467 [Hordeum vulgare]
MRKESKDFNRRDESRPNYLGWACARALLPHYHDSPKPVPLPLRPLDPLFLCVAHSPTNLASGTNDDQKIVALDVEFTWPHGPTQMAAVVQLCVGIYILVYHISVADENCGLLVAFLLDEEYTFVGVDINND